MRTGKIWVFPLQSSLKECIYNVSLHVSVFFLKGTTGLQSSSASVEMPKPQEKYLKLAPLSKAGVPAKGNTLQPAFAAQNLEDVAYYNVDVELCLECNAPLQKKGHFT